MKEIIAIQQYAATTISKRLFLYSFQNTCIQT